MDSLLSFLYQVFSSIGPFVILLGLLVFVHELGHFLVAKWCGVRVETFSLGFGKKLLKYKYGDTVYTVSLIPLGGYVKMFGDNPQLEVSEEDKDKSFLHKPVAQRIAVVLAGPLMNLFFAFVLFVFIGFIGDRQPAPILGDIEASTAAYSAGFRPGDTILSVNGRDIQGWAQVHRVVSESTDKKLNFKVSRNGKPVEISATPEAAPNENIFSADSSVGHIEGLSVASNAALLGVTSPDSPAAQAGLKSLDLVTHVNGKEISTYRELEKAVASNTTQNLSLIVQSLKDGKRAKEERKVTLPAQKSLSELGIEYAQTYILQVKEDSPAAQAGLQSGDEILSIGQVSTKNWNDILEAIKNYDPAKQENIDIAVSRGGKELHFSLIPEMTSLTNPSNGSEEHRFTIGIMSSNFQVGPETVLYRPQGILNKLVFGVQQTWQWTEFTVMSIVRVFQGTVSAKNIGGVITIGRVASHSFEAGLSVFLKTMAIISINLFLLNLLPVPVLDGGHLVFFGLEAIKGSPVSLRKLEIAQQVGLTLLLLLMAFALFNDVNNLFSSGPW